MLGFKGFLNAFLFDLIRHIRFGFGFHGFFCISGTLNFKVPLLASDFRFGLHFGEFGFLFCFRFRDTLILFLLGNVPGSHGVNDIAILVGKVLDGQVDNLQTHVAHVRHGGDNGFLSELIPILHQLRDSHLTDDFTHVAFQHVLSQQFDLIGVIMEKLLRGGGNGKIVRTDLDICNRIHQD